MLGVALFQPSFNGPRVRREKEKGRGKTKESEPRLESDEARRNVIAQVQFDTVNWYADAISRTNVYPVSTPIDVGMTHNSGTTHVTIK